MGTTDGDAIESVGDRIARLRRTKGWHQEELGKRIGATGGQISKYERGASFPRPAVLSRLGEVLGVSLDYLMTGQIGREVRQDFRLRERLDALEALPEPQRNNLVAFLDSLITAHQVLRRSQERRQRQRRGARKR